MLKNNQNIADVGVILGVLGQDTTKWLDNLMRECDGDIEQFLEVARQRADIELIAAAVKAAMGYDYEETDQSYIKVPDGYDAKNQPVMKDVPGNKKVKTKKALPNESLLRFILKNRLPEYFSETKKIEINKKTIEIKEVAAREIEEFGRKLLESVQETEPDNGKN